MDIANIVTAIATAGTLLFMIFQWVVNRTPSAIAFADKTSEKGWRLVRITVAPSERETFLTYITSSHGALSKAAEGEDEYGDFAYKRDHDSLPLSRLDVNDVIQSSTFLGSSGAFSDPSKTFFLYAFRNSESKKPFSLCIRYKVWIFTVRSTVIPKIAI